MLRVGQWGGLAGILDAWRAGVLLAAAWTGSCAVLEVVFSERLSLVADGHPTPTAPLLIALKHPDSVVQVRAHMQRGGRLLHCSAERLELIHMGGQAAVQSLVACTMATFPFPSP